MLNSDDLWNIFLHRTRILGFVPHRSHWKHIRKRFLNSQYVQEEWLQQARRIVWPSPNNCYNVGSAPLSKTCLCAVALGLPKLKLRGQAKPLETAPDQKYTKVYRGFTYFWPCSMAISSNGMSALYVTKVVGCVCVLFNCGTLCLSFECKSSQ